MKRRRPKRSSRARLSKLPLHRKPLKHRPKLSFGENFHAEFGGFVEFAAGIFASAHHNIHWHWVKGHAGHTENERCEELANEAIAAVKARHTPQQLAKLLEEFKALSDLLPS